MALTAVAGRLIYFGGNEGACKTRLLFHYPLILYIQHSLLLSRLPIVSAPCHSIPRVSSQWPTSLIIKPALPLPQRTAHQLRKQLRRETTGCSHGLRNSKPDTPILSLMMC